MSNSKTPVNTLIKCPHCSKSFEPSEAYKHELEEKFITEIETKHQEELEKIINENKKLQEEKLREIEEIKNEALESVQKQVAEKVAKELTDKEDQIQTLKKRVVDAEAEEIKIRKEKRELEDAKQKFEVEKERQLDAEREKIKKEAITEVEEKDRFVIEEYKKQLSDMSKALEEAKRKGAQGSQQLQGEVMELDVENLLIEAFPDDEIVPVGKGQLGGDIIQKVKGKSGRVAGVILWETKRANWQKTWLSKLREDARKVGATMSVLLSVNLPPDVSDFKLTEGVVVCSYKHALTMAAVLRRFVLHIAVAKQTAENKDENLEMLYEYLQSEAFRHRFEAFAEGVVSMETDLDYERRAMERIWKKREMQIKKMKINVSRMYGELQGVMGSALPDIKILSLPDGEKDKLL
jgi:hypothetical protein